MAFVLEGLAISSTWLAVFAACFLFAMATVLAGRAARLGILALAAFGLTLPSLPLPPWSTAPGNVVFVLGIAAAIEFRRRTALSLAICWISAFLLVSWLNRGTPGLLKALDDSLLHLSLCNAGSFFLAVSIPAVAAVDIARQKAEFGELIQAVKDSEGHVVSRVQRVLHDRVIAVLMTISNSGMVDRRSVDEAIDEIRGVASDVAPDAARPTDLVALLGGLTSRTTLSVEIRLLGRPGGWPAVSAHQAGAVARALEEVLRNAERHGTGDGLLLTAAHGSRGFVVTAENTHRSGPAQAGGWGWVNSVRMPMEAIGGGATRASGAETSRVEIWWPVTAQLPEHQRVYAETVGALGPAGTGVITLIWPVLAAHTYLGLRYTPSGMAAAWHVLSWMMVLGVTVAAARRLRQAPLGGVAHLGISVVLVGACWLSLQALPPITLRSYESWILGLISVPQSLLAFFSPARRVALSVTPVTAVVVWYALAQDGPGLADSAGALVAAAGPWCGVLLGWLLRNTRRRALAQEARLRDQSTRLYVKLTDRQVEERYLSGTRSVVLPWLAALADGSLSAADPTVRDEARLLAMRTRDDLYLPGVLDRPLQERITTARRRGVTVTIHPLEGDAASEVMLAFRLLDRALDHLDPGGRALVHLRDGGRAFTLSLIAPTEVDWLGHLTPALSTVPHWTRADDFATTIGVGLPDSGDGVGGRARVKRRVGTQGGRQLDLVAVDNQQVVLAGLKSLAFSHPDVVRSVATFEQVAEVDVSIPPPDVVILDYWLGRDDRDSVDAVAAFRHWGAHVVLYTTEEKPVPLARALRAGVDAVCLKNDGLEPLVATLVLVAQGQPALSGPLARAITANSGATARLTEAEQRVLNGLAYGLSTAEIAHRLVVAESTIAAHEKNIHNKYRQAYGGDRITRARVLYESLRDGYWDARAVDADEE